MAKDYITTCDSICDYNTAFAEETLNPLVTVVDFSKMVGKSVPGKKTYGFYLVMLKDTKCADILYGRNMYDFQDGTLLFLAPGQVLDIKQPPVHVEPNDTINDLDVHVFKGKDHIFEEMEGLRFKVGPKSFYQTNSEQAYNLYKIARNFAGLTGNELVYDLYTGTGTIANFVSRQARQVIGIEYVPEAIEDAKVNAEINDIKNAIFYAGDMKDMLTQDFINQHGRPDVIITDPPRAGMHQDVIDVILFAEPKRIVYVSCNPATQARDLQLLNEKYKVKAVQPVDMFPHTHHVENVVLLKLR